MAKKNLLCRALQDLLETLTALKSLMKRRKSQQTHTGKVPQAKNEGEVQQLFEAADGNQTNSAHPVVKKEIQPSENLALLDKQSRPKRAFPRETAIKSSLEVRSEHTLPIDINLSRNVSHSEATSVASPILQAPFNFNSSLFQHSTCHQFLDLDIQTVQSKTPSECIYNIEGANREGYLPFGRDARRLEVAFSKRIQLIWRIILDSS